MVNRKCMVDRCRLPGEILATGGLQSSLDQTENPRKIKILVKEFGHSDFIGRVQDRRRAATHLKRLPGKSEGRKSIEVRTFERQSGRLGEIETRRRTVDAPRPRQAMRNRNSHIRAPELGDQ